MLVSAVVLILMLMNTYGQRQLQIELTPENVAAEDAWQSYAPHLTLPRGEYVLTVQGSGSVAVRSSEGTLRGGGNAPEPVRIRLEKDESNIIF